VQPAIIYHRNTQFDSSAALDRIKDFENNIATRSNGSMRSSVDFKQAMGNIKRASVEQSMRIEESSVNTPGTYSPRMPRSQNRSPQLIVASGIQDSA
jgi:hypothetical protein